MNNIIEKDENMLGYVRDIKKYITSEIEKLKSEELNIAKTCGNVDSEYYEYIISISKDLLEDLQNEKDYELVYVMYNPMGSYFYRKASVIDSETKEELM